MSLIDLILNLAGLLLWISWRYVPFDPLNKIRPATLAGTLRRAEPQRIRRWHFLAALLCLLAVRAFFYQWIGAALNWTPGIELGAITVFFRSDILLRMLLFSFGSFGHTLMLFYLCLILLSLANRPGSDANACQRFIRIQLGGMRNWPWFALALLPFLVLLISWIAAAPLLAKLQIVPPPQSPAHLLEQSVLLALNVYLLWKYLIAVVLTLHLMNTYVYVGNQPFWAFITTTGTNLLRPLQRLPLRIGRVDFAPVLGIIIAFGFAELAQRGLSHLFARLPF